MTIRGSQRITKIEDAGYWIVNSWPELQMGDIHLEDKETGKKELWRRNDDFSGHVIEINGRRYEFIRSLS